MTENEAKSLMLIEKECINRDCNRDCAKCDIVQEVDNLNNAYDTAIKALEEVQQYRQIGTVSTCRNAVGICKTMIERGINPDNIAEYIKFEDNLVQRGYDLKKLIEMMEEHKQYRQICTVEECLRNKDFLDFLADKMNPNDFETYLSMYNSSGEKQEDERWEN